MLKILLILVIFSITSNSLAASLATPFTNVSSVVFAQTSSAKTSTPNLRIVAQYGRMSQIPVTSEIQGAAINSVSNFYLTKKVYLKLNGYLWWKAYVDQDTQVYINGSPNYFIIPNSGIDGTVVYK